VKDQQVEPLDAELADALLERVQGGVGAVVADPDLGLDEDVPGRMSERLIASPTSRSFP
jgi:hypothetical protein